MATLSDLSPGQWITLLTEMVGENVVPLWGRYPKLTPWRSDLEDRLAEIKAASSRPAPAAPQQAPLPSVALDRLAEAPVRVVHHIIRAQYYLHIALAEPDKALKVQEAQEFVFDRGLSFLNASYGAQVGETDRMVNLARQEALSSALSSVSLEGRDFQALLDLVVQNNAPLKARLQAEAAPTPSASPTPEQLARGLVSLFLDLMPLIERALPAQQGEQATDKRTLLASLNRELEVARRRLQRPIPAPTEPSEG